MHLPKLSLRVCRFRSFSSAQSVRVSPDGWEVSKDKPQVITEELPNASNHRVDLTAVNAFKVTVLEQSDRRVLGAQRTVGFGCRIFKSNNFRTTHDSISTQAQC